MTWKTTVVFEKNIQAYLDGKRHIFNEGGTSSSKTYSIIQLLIIITANSKSPYLTSIVAESMPHIKRGALRDFEAIMGEKFNPALFNKSDYIYRFANGSMLEFFSADNPAKLRGARRDILFVNELNNIAYDAYREMDVRTKRLTFADWNPVSEFFVHQNRLYDDPDSILIHSTYLDAQNILSQDVITNILAMGERDPNWANVYIHGLLGKVEGLVYPYFSQVDVLPENGRIYYGLDFGFTNDPTALVKCCVVGNDLYCDELIYETGLTNDQIATRMEQLGLRKHYDEIWADSAEPKSIEEIYRRGYNIKGVTKSADSVSFGHQKVLQFKQFWTKRSLNGIKEQRNFRYVQDKDGKFTEKTIHTWSHLMDARRYGVMGTTVAPTTVDLF